MRAGRKAVLLLALAALALAVAGCGRDKEKKEAGSSGAGNVTVLQSALEPVGPAPEFTLVDQDGREVRSQDLRGKVALYNFVYTSCKSVCPTASAQFAAYRDELKKEGLLGDKVMLVTISFDPARDTPAVLKEYSKKYGADPANWLWLTGPQAEVDRVVLKGFNVYYQKIPAEQQAGSGAAGDAGTAGGGKGSMSGTEHGHEGDDPPPPPGYDMDHMNIIVLVDPQGVIRAYYPGTGVAPQDLVGDIKRLL